MGGASALQQAIIALEERERQGISVLSAAQHQSIDETCDARNDSLDALEALSASALVPDALKLRFQHLLKLGLRVEILRFTFEAGELRGRVRPTKMYLKKVAAVPARYFDQCPVVVHFRHGWPILSLVFGNSNVTEAEALKKGLGGGSPHDPDGEAA